MFNRNSLVSAGVVAVALGLLATGGKTQAAAGEVTVPVAIDTTKLKLPSVGPVVLWADPQTGYRLVGQVVRGKVTNIELFAPGSGRAVPPEAGSSHQVLLSSRLCLLKKCWKIHFFFFKKKICIEVLCFRL